MPLGWEGFVLTPEALPIGADYRQGRTMTPSLPQETAPKQRRPVAPVRDAMMQAPAVLLDLDDPIAESLYHHLSSSPLSTKAEAALALGVSQAQVVVAANTLTAEGIAELADQGWLRVVPPQSAARARLARLEDELTTTRLLLESANEEFVRARSRSAEAVRIVGPDEIHGFFLQGQANARKQIRGIMKPPFLGKGGRNKDAQTERMAQGIEYRAIYDEEILADQQWVKDLLYVVELGGHVRIMKNAPMKLVIFDDERALALFAVDDVEGLQTMVVERCGLLEALIALHDGLFESALLLDAATAEEEVCGETERELLSLMAAGFTDAAIARHWDVSTRTVERRISAITQLLGVTSRFQAGLAARERGWI